MNKWILAGLFYLLVSSVCAQVLRDQNYSHLYNPNAPFDFSFAIVKLNEGYKVFYQYIPADTGRSENVTIQFETRESLSEKNGIPVAGQLTEKRGSFTFLPGANQPVLMARVTVTDQMKTKTFLYHKRLPLKKSPYLMIGSKVVTRPFILANQTVSIVADTTGPMQVSYYRSDFPAAAPAFATTQSKVPRSFTADSVFRISSTITLQQKGLYLVQHDTAASEGFAFRVETDYPKLTRMESLAAPLIYVCTKQETEKLKQAGNEKKKFDQVILNITGNAERARTFMRSYFKRVESANMFFISYKEGWKTDRGMIYIIYGPPDEVYLFDDREVWDYKNENMKGRVHFVKSPTVFDPDNYVLVRDKKHSTTWYKIVDLWRKARF